LKESRDPDILNASRRRRIAAGSGMEVQDVNRLIKQLREAQKMMKMFRRLGEVVWVVNVTPALALGASVASAAKQSQIIEEKIFFKNGIASSLCSSQ